MRSSISYLTCVLGKLKEQDVIFCEFEFDPERLAHFKKNFPSANWLRTDKCWYLPDSSLNRKRLGLEPKPIGSGFEADIHVVNQPSFIAFRDALEQRAYSPATVRTYLSEFAQLLKLLEAKSVNNLTTEQLNAYFLYCIRKLKLSENQVQSRMNAVKAYFVMVLNRKEIFDHVPRPKAAKQLPQVLSKQEIIRLFSVIENPKHLLLLRLCYGMGLRVSEIVNLKVKNIDSDRMQVRIEAAKGKKDRYVNLPSSALEQLRFYYREYRPSVYLFEGQFGGQYSVRSVQLVFKKAMEKAKINKKIGVHGLRHSFATHLLEAGTDMVFIQKLLGHANVKTTEVYAKVSRRTTQHVRSPLDDL